MAVAATRAATRRSKAKAAAPRARGGDLERDRLDRLAAGTFPGNGSHSHPGVDGSSVGNIYIQIHC
eukprot:171196-Pyramimonas_sp.AAC.1